MNTDPIGASLNPIEQDRFQRHLAFQAIWHDPWTFAIRVVSRFVYMWGTDTSILDFVMGDAPPGGVTPMKAVLYGAIQVSWAWFICTWWMSIIQVAPWKRQHAVFELWIVCWVAVIWVLHSIVEPHSRHHLALLPLMGSVFLPTYSPYAQTDI